MTLQYPIAQYTEIRNGKRAIFQLCNGPRWTLEGINLAGKPIAIPKGAGFNDLEAAISAGRKRLIQLGL